MANKTDDEDWIEKIGLYSDTKNSGTQQQTKMQRKGIINYSAIQKILGSNLSRQQLSF